MNIDTTATIPYKVFGFDNDKDFEKGFKANKRMAHLAMIISILHVDGTFLSMVAVLEVTTGLTTLRSLGGLVDYFDKSLNDKEIEKLSTMLFTLHEACKK